MNPTTKKNKNNKTMTYHPNTLPYIAYQTYPNGIRFELGDWWIVVGVN